MSNHDRFTARFLAPLALVVGVAAIVHTVSDDGAPSDCRTFTFDRADADPYTPIDVRPCDTLNIVLDGDAGWNATWCADAGGTLHGTLCADTDF